MMGLLNTGLSRRHILWSVDRSLQRLGTDWIDVYIVHREDPHTPLEETLSALDAIVRAGKVRYLGFSNWSAWKVAAAQRRCRRPSTPTGSSRTWLTQRLQRRSRRADRTD
ncbi:MAG TPA: aldo/keto reductase [Dongiaceae bacterium]|jgi:aryl-alcohol dehydrogenase-like predicted oxidoreductase|nr:aldo/keto reductase [Dongiaceae bacterium]